MALVSIARHGYSTAGGKMDGVPPQGRGDSRGWSKRSRKSNEEFLQSIDFEHLNGVPYAVTLTLPTTRTPDSTEFHAMLRAYHKGFAGMFQIDGRIMWLDIAADHGFECRITAQDIKPITSVGVAPVCG